MDVQQTIFECPHCRAVVRLPANLHGRKIICSACQQTIVVPSTQALESPAVPPFVPPTAAASPTTEAPSTAAALRLSTLLPPRFLADLPGSAPSSNQMESPPYPALDVLPLATEQRRGAEPIVEHSDYVTVTIRDKPYRLRRLTAEEIAVQTGWRNGILFVAGAIILTIAATLLMRR